MFEVCSLAPDATFHDATSAGAVWVELPKRHRATASIEDTWALRSLQVRLRRRYTPGSDGLTPGRAYSFRVVAPATTADGQLIRSFGQPSVPLVIKNMAGSIKGEDSQNAITALNGAPIARSAAINGITSHEQKGDKPPKKAAKMIILNYGPEKAFDNKFSAPVAFK